MSNIPIHEPVGNDTENWTTLTNKEAKIRAKAVEKGHMPHDWRWGAAKVFKTDKFYPESMRGDVLAKAPDTKEETGTDLPRENHDMRSEGMDLAGANTSTNAVDPQNRSMRGYEGVEGPLQPTTQGGRGLENDANWEQRDRLSAPSEGGPEMVGGREKASEPIVQTNIVG